MKQIIIRDDDVVYRAEFSDEGEPDAGVRETRFEFFTLKGCEDMDPETYATDVLRTDERRGDDTTEVLEDVAEYPVDLGFIGFMLAKAADYVRTMTNGCTDGDERELRMAEDLSKARAMLEHLINQTTEV